MVEEMRFFLRIALFSLIVGAIYWFVSYDVVGTVLLVGVGVGAVSFMVPIARAARVWRNEPVPPEGPFMRRAVSGADRIIGFDERHDLSEAGALAVAEEPLPRSSIWPLAGSIAALLVALGLVFGGWFWMPGVAMGAAVAWGWLNQLET